MAAVDIVRQTLDDALRCEASDIHIESVADGLRVRFRVDGILFDRALINKDQSLQVLARIKVLARLDVAEKRVPQDGKFSSIIDASDIDFRVATFPGLHGEKIVIRILKRDGNAHALQDLGLDPDLYKALFHLINRPTGFFLATGPTGSGKTTTLYAILQSIHSPQKNVVTLEDPIEYNIAGITQGQVVPEIGFTFARGLRALLRGDPDIIMVGEIRDKETAEVAIQAALTGHFVLSTSHTNDAVGALMRLIDMGIPPFLINGTLSAVLAQRLVRVLCHSCKFEDVLTHDEKEFISYVGISISKTYRARGCDDCSHIGYKGRTGIFELLTMTDPIRALVSKHMSYDAIVTQARNENLVPLRIDALHKIQSGITSISELARTLW